MTQGPCFSEDRLACLRDACSEHPSLVALYSFDLRRGKDCSFAALLARGISWSDRLDLEVAVSNALQLRGMELINLRRMPLVARFDVVERGEPLYVGQADILAIFIEETIMRYSAFYPLLEALYWKVETGPLVEDNL